MNVILSSVFEIARRLGGGDTHTTVNDIIHFGPTYHDSSPSQKSSSASTNASSTVAAAMVVTGAVAVVAAANHPSAQAHARGVMDSVRARERVRRSASGKAVGVYIRPLGAMLTVRREGKTSCAVRAVTAPDPQPVEDEPSPEEVKVTALRLPQNYDPPRRAGKAASFVRFRSTDDVSDAPDRADCVYVDGVGWFVVVQRHGRVHVGVTRFAAADLIQAVDTARHPRFSVVTEVALTGGTPPPEE